MRDWKLKTIAVCAVLAIVVSGEAARAQIQVGTQVHQRPDPDGVYYVGPEVTSPRLVRTFAVPYPTGVPAKEVQGMTVLAMVIEASGAPAHIQTLHTHGETFDRYAIEAVKRSTFEPGRLGGEPVPVWIDVRVIFRTNHSQAVPQILITERDLGGPTESQLEDKHHNPLPYTPPFPIHTVDADFADPFSAHPYVQVATVTVDVGEDGLPRQVWIRRGLGFGLDEKAIEAAKHFRFLPATKRGNPVAASTEVAISFERF